MKNSISRAAVVAAASAIAGTALMFANAALADTKEVDTRNAAARFVVSYEAEAAGVQNTTATFSVGGVETFENIKGGEGNGKSFATSFGTKGENRINGVYSALGSQKSGGEGKNAASLLIKSADQYGGAGGAGHYIAAFTDSSYQLSLSSEGGKGVNYFGYWLSALDRGNSVTFYGEGDRKLFTFNPEDAIKAIASTPNPSLYYGNPNAPFKGKDSGEPFIFLNFFDTNGSFSKVVFNEVNFGGGYESDNHTVGHYLTMGEGTQIKLVQSASAVPELSTWAMMALGFGGIFYGSRRNTLRLAI